MAVDITLRDLGWATEVRLSGVGGRPLLETVGRGIAAVIDRERPTVIDIEDLRPDEPEALEALVATVEASLPVGSVVSWGRAVGGDQTEIVTWGGGGSGSPTAR